jgi:hypothetical protein
VLADRHFTREKEKYIIPLRFLIQKQFFIIVFIPDPAPSAG